MGHIRFKSMCLLVALCVGLGMVAIVSADDPPATPATPTPPAANPEAKPAVAKEPGLDWPYFRGDALATGVSATELSESLSVAWKFAVDKGSFEATPIIADGTVFVGDLDGTFYALALADGAVRWKFKNDAGFVAPAGIRGGKIFVGDVDGHFHCLDAASGKPLWEVKDEVSGKSFPYFITEAEIDGGPAFDGDHVLVGSQDAHLYCLDAASGKLVWKHAIEDQIRCTPTLVAGKVFLAGCDGKLHLIDVTTGKEAGSIEIGAPTGSTPAVLGDQAFFGTEGAVFFGVNWKATKVDWQYRDERRSLPFRSSAALTKEILVFGGRDKQVHALNPANGEVKWTFATRQRVDSSPVIVGKRVYVAAGDGKLYVLDLADGKQLSLYDAGGGFTSSPAVAAKRMVIGNEDGTLYCFQ